MSEEDDRAWALMRSPAFEEELRLVREEGEKVAMFAQLRYHALSMKRKLGWAAYFFKSIYGHFPDRAWDKVPPMQPTEQTMELIEARDRRFVYEVRMKHRKEERVADEQRVGNGEASEELHSGTEGAGGLHLSGRVCGLGEESDGDGELCPPDE